jgi:hypothetical protein
VFSDVPPLPYDFIAIAITILPANNVAIPHDAPLNSEQATNHIHKVHYVGIHHILCNKPIVSCLNSSQILLLPFILYPFSAPGYFVHQFFFLHTSTQVPPALDHPGLIISLAPTPILLLIQALASRSNFHVHPLHHTTYYYFHEITKSG